MEMKDAALMGQIESYAHAKELDGHNEMLEESTKYQLLPKEKVLHMEFDLEEKLREVGDALDKAIIELSDTIHERNEMELELQGWMLYVERLRKDLEENFVTRKRLENSLLAQMELNKSKKLVIRSKQLHLNQKSKQVALHIEAEIDTEQFKTKDLTNQRENKLLNASDDLLQKIKMENRNLHENATRLSSEKEILLLFIRLSYEKICDSTIADTEIMDMLNNLGHSLRTLK
ncbi:unnamed protein product [Lupinus luteus]|uniref:Uncharacterized protein n=1 Tax=Lupinus luteus TaxID=3873 RepID=A0AAV1YC27_LUPLU